MYKSLLALMACLACAPAWAEMKDDRYYAAVALDEFEVQWIDGDAKLAWDGAVSYGNDDHAFVLEHAGARDLEAKSFDGADVRLLIEWPVTDFFDLSVGAGALLGPGADHAFGVVKIAGLMKQFIYSELAIVAGGDADLMMEWELAYDMHFGQRIVGALSVEGALAATDDHGAGIARGLVSIGASYRLHYEVSREFAPYIGWQGDWLLGNNADWARAAGQNDNEQAMLVGVRLSL